jgi:hypothetical protein
MYPGTLLSEESDGHHCPPGRRVPNLVHTQML